MKPIFSSSSSTKLPGEERRRHLLFGRSTPLGQHLVQSSRPTTKQSLPACSSSRTRVCAARARLEYIRVDGGRFLASGGRTARGSSISCGNVHSVARGPSPSSLLLLLLQPLPPRRLSKLNSCCSACRRSHGLSLRPNCWTHLCVLECVVNNQC